MNEKACKIPPGRALKKGTGFKNISFGDQGLPAVEARRTGKHPNLGGDQPVSLASGLCNGEGFQMEGFRIPQLSDVA